MRSPTQSTVWRIIACDRASKSNIGTRCLSAETIGAIEEALDVGLDRRFQRGEAAIVARAAQTGDITLREVLVAAANLLRHLDIFDICRLAERGIGCEHQVLEAARLAGSNIEDAADRWRRQ